MLRKNITHLLKAALAIGIIVILINKKFLVTAHVWKLASFPSVILLFLILYGSILTATWRWQVLLRGQEIVCSFWNLHNLQFIGLFFGYILPGGVTGDLIKGYYLTKISCESRGKLYTSSIFERLLGLWTMIAMIIVSAFLLKEKLADKPTLISLVAVITGTWATGTLLWVIMLLWRPETLPSIINKPLKHLIEFSKPSVSLLRGILISILMYFLTALFMFIGGHKHGLTLTLSETIFLVSLGSLSTLIPITPAGIGVGQISYFFIFDTYLKGTGQLASALLSLYQLLTFASSTWGAWNVFNIKKRSVNPITQVFQVQSVNQNI